MPVANPGFFQGNPKALDDDFRGGSVCSDINAHMTHYAEKTEEYERAAEQSETFTYAGGSVGLLLIDGSGGQ